jgi:urease accessory protein
VRYPFVVLRPFWFGDLPDGLATVILQSGSGGLYAGEELSQLIVMEPGSAAQVTSQAASVVHASRGLGATEQGLLVKLGEGSYLEYLSEPLIMFPGAKLSQTVEAHVSHDSVFVHSEGIVRHDPSGGDATFDMFSSAFELRDEDGRLLFRESTSVDGHSFVEMMPAGDKAWAATGLVIAAAPGAPSEHQRWSAVVSGRLSQLPDAYAACGLLPNAAGLVCRIVAADGQALRAALELAWREVRVLVTGRPAPRSRK